MDKLSGIVPTSSRHMSSRPEISPTAVRPGAPPFGRPMGTSALAEKKTMDDAQRAAREQREAQQMQLQTPSLAPNPEVLDPVDREVQIVRDLTDRFSNPTLADRLATQKVSGVAGAQAPVPTAGAMTPPGSFIDVHA